jgi:hypothetical protein
MDRTREGPREVAIWKAEVALVARRISMNFVERAKHKIVPKRGAYNSKMNGDVPGKEHPFLERQLLPFMLRLVWVCRSRSASSPAPFEALILASERWTLKPFN